MRATVMIYCSVSRPTHPSSFTWSKKMIPSWAGRIRTVFLFLLSSLSSLPLLLPQSKVAWYTRLPTLTYLPLPPFLSFSLFSRVAGRLKYNPLSPRYTIEVPRSIFVVPSSSSSFPSTLRGSLASFLWCFYATALPFIRPLWPFCSITSALLFRAA